MVTSWWEMKNLIDCLSLGRGKRTEKAVILAGPSLDLKPQGRQLACCYVQEFIYAHRQHERKAEENRQTLKGSLAIDGPTNSSGRTQTHIGCLFGQAHPWSHTISLRFWGGAPSQQEGRRQDPHPSVWPASACWEKQAWSFHLMKNLQWGNFPNRLGVMFKLGNLKVIWKNKSYL